MLCDQIQKASEQHLFQYYKRTYNHYLKANRAVGVVFGAATGLIFLTSLYTLAVTRSRYLPVAFLSAASLSGSICYGLSLKPPTQDLVIALVGHLIS
jgi:hypothetical protein